MNKDRTKSEIPDLNLPADPDFHSISLPLSLDEIIRLSEAALPRLNANPTYQTERRISKRARAFEL